MCYILIGDKSIPMDGVDLMRQTRTSINSAAETVHDKWNAEIDDSVSEDWNETTRF